jgi:D-alanyl-lipoteichoic acid acyltransferase DltB (MBOAT superfamily)
MDVRIVKTYRNLMLTMLVGGLWHRANWTFVIWGGYHGALLSLERMTGRGRGRVMALSVAVSARSGDDVRLGFDWVGALQSGYGP